MFNFTNINFTGKTNAELDRSQNLLKTGKLDFFQIKDQKSLKTSIYGCPLQVYQLLPGREREKGF